MEKSGTGAQDQQLLAGSTDNPSLTQGAATTWSLNTVPDRCPSGPLAYYLPYVTLTIAGNLVQSGTAGSVVQWDALKSALIDSVDWTQSFFGTVLGANHVKGTYLPIIEYISGGGEFALPPREPFPATAGTYPFEMTVALPALSCMMGDLGINTSHLAKLFQTSNIKVNIAGSSVLTALSAGASFSSLTAKMSAHLVPSGELICGTPIEWILTSIPVATNVAQNQIQNFGTDTLVSGCENKGGVLWLGALTSAGVLGGAFAAQNVTQYEFSWAGQPSTQHMEGVVSTMWRGIAGYFRSQAFPAVVSGGDAQNNSYPYVNGTSNQPTTSSSKMDRVGLAAWIMRQPSVDCQLTDLQTADGDKPFFLQISGGYTTTANLLVGAYARQTTENLRDKWVAQMIKEGDNSLAAYVLGPGYMAAVNKGLRQRIPRKRHQTTADQKTYLPFQLAY